MPERSRLTHSTDLSNTDPHFFVRGRSREEMAPHQRGEERERGKRERGGPTHTTSRAPKRNPPSRTAPRTTHPHPQRGEERERGKRERERETKKPPSPHTGRPQHTHTHTHTQTTEKK